MPGRPQGTGEARATHREYSDCSPQSLTSLSAARGRRSFGRKTARLVRKKVDSPVCPRRHNLFFSKCLAKKFGAKGEKTQKSRSSPSRRRWRRSGCLLRLKVSPFRVSAYGRVGESREIEQRGVASGSKRARTRANWPRSSVWWA